MIEPVASIVVAFMRRLTEFLPNFVGGLAIFLIGILSASLLRRFFITFFRFFRFSAILERMRLMQKSEVYLWEQIISEIIRWTVVILFLIPTLEAWGLSRATVVLNQLLLYIPNVIIAVIISFVGIVAANLVSDLVHQSIKSIGKTSAQTLAFLTKSVVIFFTILVVLNQLGVAQDLIRILFTGIIAMFAIAGGLAFGLGGQDSARELLNHMKKVLKQQEEES
ncbi:MAG: hypothetical protein N2691_03470 [Patescibacteria group bacterium]|nr:hypothetical protein [Patescibacteria group bacterium]